MTQYSWWQIYFLISNISFHVKRLMILCMLQNYFQGSSAPTWPTKEFSSSPLLEWIHVASNSSQNKIQGLVVVVHNFYPIFSHNIFGLLWSTGHFHQSTIHPLCDSILLRGVRDNYVLRKTILQHIFFKLSTHILSTIV